MGRFRHRLPRVGGDRVGFRISPRHHRVRGPRRLLPAGAMGYALGIKSLLVLNVEFYTGIGTTLLDPRLVDPVPDNHGMAGKEVLIVDDVADSGRTLEFVHGICRQSPRGSHGRAVREAPAPF